MIPDAHFKLLFHNCKGYKIHTKGNNLEPGYKPDYSLKKDNDYIILESESATSRKTYVGGMIKAAHFLQGEKTGTLVYIITPRPNTSVSAIAKHLKLYLDWLNDKTNLRDVYVIDSFVYYKENVLLTLLGKDFKAVALKV